MDLFLLSAYVGDNKDRREWTCALTLRRTYEKERKKKEKFATPLRLGLIVVVQMSEEGSGIGKSGMEQMAVRAGTSSIRSQVSCTGG